MTKLENLGTMKISRSIVLCLLVGFAITAKSQHNIKFEHLDINSGLSQNHIMCILQDSRGFMWFGTRDGLNKYDGYKFTIYKNDAKDPHSISNNFITGIAEDSKGMIWITTRGGGLNQYDKNKNSFTAFKTDPASSNSISSDLLSGIAIDEQDNLWISTENAGLDYFIPEKKQCISYRHDKNNPKSLSDNNTVCVFNDSKRNIWVGTYTGGLNLFDKNTRSFVRYQHDDANASSLAHNNVRIIFEDSRHQMWIGTVGGGLDLYQPDTRTFRHFTPDLKNPGSISGNVIAALGEDKSGNLWVGTENNGLNIYDRSTGTFQKFMHDDIDNKSVSHNSIYSVYRDASNNMWVGTFAGGINIYNKDVNKFAHYKHTSSANSLSHNNVLCISESKDGRLWVGTDGGGLDLFDPKTKNFTHYKHDEKNKNSICGDYVLTVREDANGNVWIGTWANGLTIFNPVTNKYRHFKNIPDDHSSLNSNNVWAIYEDDERNVWVGCYGGGLHLFDSTTNSFIRFDDTTSSVVMRQIYAIREDDKGNLWLSTDGGGLRIFNKKSRTFSRFIQEQGRNSISDDRINYVHEDKSGNLWIGTMSGLNYYDIQKRSFTTYTTADGLSNNVIFGILDDAAGNLWMSTNRGLSRFNPRTKQFRNFSPADGLQSYEFKGNSLCKTRAGIMYFGGINGFNEFDPADIRSDAFEPPLVFTDFQVFNKKIPIAKDDNDPSPLKKDISETKEITLSYGNAVISFEFASLNYTVAEKKKYAYMLEGFDRGWNEIGTNRTATYTNLDPGTYTFKVKGLTNDGNWSTRTISLRLIITPPFWMTWWFRITVLVAIIGAAIAFYRYRVSAINAQRMKLQLQVQEQTWMLKESAEEEHRAREDAELANKELERKNKELEQFAFVASHDLQEPLRTTASFVELLQKQYQGKLDDKADKYLVYISKSTERMKALIKDLLDYSRIGRKQQIELVDCNVVLQEMLADLAVAIEEKKAVIKSEHLPVIQGYPMEMKQLFQNLVINAIKFSKPGVAPEVNISVQRIKGFWQFAVQDNGIGMEEKHSDKIFIIFQRLHTRNQYEGSGIGLAHCKKIVELHGGKIWIKSKPGEGSTFYFTIKEKMKFENKAKMQVVE
jgi:signal transduction histidine kinase/ligand-binding sensor domain-containing protein